MFAELRVRKGTDWSDYDILRNVSGLTFDSKYQDIGAFSFTVTEDDAKTYGLKDQSVIQVAPNGSDFKNMWFEIEGTSKNKVVDGVKYCTFAGKSIVSWLSDAIVYPSTWPETPVVNPDGTTATVIQGHSFQDATPGNIIRTLVARAVERGALLWVDVSSFSGTTDSSGSAWNSTLTTTYANGTTVLSVLQDLASRNLIEYSFDGMTFNLYNYGSTGVHHTADEVTFFAGKNITEQSTNTDSSASATVVLIVGDEAAITESDDNPTLDAAIGRRREKFVAQGGITDGPTLKLLANSELGSTGHIQVEETLGVNDTDLQPWVNYNVGDWVWEDADGTLQNIQIRQIAASLQDNNSLQIGITLGDMLSDADEKLQQKINNITGGASGTGYGGLPNQHDYLSPSPPTSVVATPTAYRDSNGIDAVQMTINWSGPTTNIDGSPLADLDRYEIQYKVGGSTFWSTAPDVPANSVVIASNLSALPSGMSFTSRVRAVDTDGNASTWADQTNTISSMPRVVTSVATPSTPILVGGVQAVNVFWDGLDNTGTNYDSALSGVAIFLSDTSGFTPDVTNQVGSFGVKGGSYTVVGLDESLTYYAKLVAFDKSENESSASAQSTGQSPVQLTAGDLPDKLITGAKIADGTITTTQLTVASFGDSVTPNGSFEDLNTTTTGAAHWLRSAVFLTGGGAATTTETSGGAVGTNCLKFSFPTATTATQWVFQDGSVPTSPNDLWYVKFKVKSSVPVTGGAQLVLSFGQATQANPTLLDSNNPNIAVITANTTTNWVQYEGQILTPSGTTPGPLTKMWLALVAANGAAVADVFFDDVQVRPVGGSASIKDLSVIDAKINSLSVAKLTAGTLTAGVVLGNYITTSTTPGAARVEMKPSGFGAYDSSGNQTFFASSTDGAVTMSGTLQVPSSTVFGLNSAFAGQTTINQDGVFSTVRSSYNLAMSTGPDEVGGYPGAVISVRSGYGGGNFENATAGTFKLGFLGVWTAGLAYNASVATVQAALNGLSTLTAMGASFTVSAVNNLPGFASTANGYLLTPNQNKWLPPILFDDTGLTISGAPGTKTNYELGRFAGQVFNADVNPLSAGWGLDPVETAHASTVVVNQTNLDQDNATLNSRVNIGRLYSKQGILAYNTVSNTGRIRIPVSAYLSNYLPYDGASHIDSSFYGVKANTSYTLSFHVTAKDLVGAGNGTDHFYSAAIALGAVKVLHRSPTGTVLNTLSVGTDGYVHGITPELLLSDAALDRVPTEINRTSPKNTNSQLLSYGSFVNNSIILYESGYIRYYINFTTPATLNDGERIWLELPTPQNWDGTPNTDAGFYFNGVQLEETSSTSTGPSRFFDWSQPNVLSNIKGGCVIAPTPTLSFPSYADSLISGRVIIQEIDSRKISVGSNLLQTPALEAKGVTTLVGNSQLGFPYGDWHYDTGHGGYNTATGGTIGGTATGSGLTEPNSENGEVFYLKREGSSIDNYTNYDPFGYGPFRFRKSPNKFVYTEGVISVDEGSFFMQLPSEFAPDYQCIFNVAAGATPWSARVDIHKSGEMQLANYTGSATTGIGIYLGSIYGFPSAVEISSDEWNYIGDPGQPAFLNSWVNYNAKGGGFAPARFYMDDAGFVHLSGLVKNGITNTGATGNIFILPYSLDRQSIFNAAASSGSAEVRIFTDGSVRAYGTNGGASNGWISLEGITFMPNDTGIPTTKYGIVKPGDFAIAGPGSYRNSWSSYSSSYHDFSVYRDFFGRIHMRGLIKGGAVGTALTVPLPPYYRPAHQMFFPVETNSAQGGLDIYPDGSMAMRTFGTGSNAWVSLEGVSWFAAM